MLRSSGRSGWEGRPVRARGGEPVGTVVRTHGDDAGWPETVVLDRGDRCVAVPAGDLVLTREDLRLPWAAERIASATPLDLEAEDDAAAVGRAATAFADPSSRPLADDPEAMTVSEERLDVRIEAVPVERVSFRKRIVEEQTTVPVTIRREELEIVREPIAGEPDPGAHLGDAVPHDVVLYAERPVVTTEVVPVERVRLAKRYVTEEHVIAGEVRREQVEVERSGPSGAGGSGAS